MSVNRFVYSKGSERLSHLLRVIWLASGKIWIWTQVWMSKAHSTTRLSSEPFRKTSCFPISLRNGDFRVSPADRLPWTILSLSSESRWFLVFPIPCSASDSPTPLEMSAQQKQIHLNYEKGFAELTHRVWGNWCLNLRSLVSQCLNTAIINKVY